MCTERPYSGQQKQPSVHAVQAFTFVTLANAAANRISKQGRMEICDQFQTISRYNNPGQCKANLSVMCKPIEERVRTNKGAIQSVGMVKKKSAACRYVACSNLEVVSVDPSLAVTRP